VLKPAQIVVTDNLSTHKGGSVRKIFEGRGCELLYLPPYSLSTSSRERSRRSRAAAQGQGSRREVL
jgi:transposase